MKTGHILIFLFILTTTLSAGPPHKRQAHRPHRAHNVVHINTGWHAPTYSFYTRSYWPVAYASTQKSVSEWAPAEMEQVSVASIALHLELLDDFQKEGVITAREYDRAKDDLLDQVGETVLAEYGSDYSYEILGQIEVLHQMVKKGLVTKKEYDQQKKKLLALL